MAVDSVMEFLHSEIVKYAYESADKKGDLSTLEYLGLTTGYRFIERLTKDLTPFKNELETVKFLCTEFWTSVFKKQIDHLRTNHQGVYVLHDNAFIYLVKLSAGKQYFEYAPRYTAFSCGLIRGALLNLGINSVVSAETEKMPSCKFQINVIRS